MDTSYNYKAYCSRPTTEYTDYSIAVISIKSYIYMYTYCSTVQLSTGRSVQLLSTVQLSTGS